MSSEDEYKEAKFEDWLKVMAGAGRPDDWVCALLLLRLLILLFRRIALLLSGCHSKCCITIYPPLKPSTTLLSFVCSLSTAIPLLLAYFISRLQC